MNDAPYQSVVVTFATEKREPDSKHPEPWYEGYFVITAPSFDGKDAPAWRVSYKMLAPTLLSLLS